MPAPPAAEQKPAEDPRIAAVLAKEKDLVRKQQEWAKERDALRAELDSHKAWKAGLVKNPEALKEALGDDWYEKLTEFRLSGNKITPELVAKSVDDRLAEWERKREQTAADEKKRVEQEQQETLTRFREETTDWVKGQTDYELINLHEAHNLVTQTIENTFRQTGRIMSAKEAADQVESGLAESVKKSLSTRHFKTAPPAGAIEKRGTDSAQPRTLTNAHGAVTTPPAPPPDRPETDDERLARAIARGKAVQQSRLGT